MSIINSSSSRGQMTPTHCDRCLRCQVVKKRKRSLLLKNKRIKKGDKVDFI